VEVTREVYEAYYSERRRERTQLEKEQRHRVVHFDAWDNDDGAGAEAIPSRAVGVYESVERRVMSEELRRRVGKLNSEERALLHALFVCEKSVTELARAMNIPRKTLCDRRDRLLLRLRRMLGEG
jgi:DNA-directed RNA polymerase specialized sigma24 family protein